MPRVPSLLALAITSTLLGGCASFYELSADREGGDVQKSFAQEVDDFRATELVYPTREDVPLEAELPDDVPRVLSLKEALQVASKYSRDYQTRREGFFLRALDYTLVRRDFLMPIFAASIGYNMTDGQRLSYSDTVNADFSVSQFLPTGGTLTANARGTLVNVDSSGRNQDASLNTGLTLAQPLLRGTGSGIPYETLTQAERNVLYEARDYELFRQTFAIGIVQDYYDLVSQKRQISNLRDNIKAQQRSVDQARAIYDVGRGTQVDVFRAEQSLFGTQNALLDSEQAYQFALDRFKVQLGLPTEADLEIGDELPEEPKSVDFGVSSAIRAAFQNRLDLLTIGNQVEDAQRRVNIARNNLLPDLNLTFSYDLFSDEARNFRNLGYHEDLYTVGVQLEIPLDRKAERNSYRAALITLDRARRDLEAFEDVIIAELRDSFRSLRQNSSQIEIEAKNIESLKRRVRQATIEHEAGTATNRDVVEAQDELTVAQNQQLDRFVRYEIARLNLLRQVGILFIDTEGEIVQ